MASSFDRDNFDGDSVRRRRGGTIPDASRAREQQLTVS
jgi:hypothetical protein